MLAWGSDFFFCFCDLCFVGCVCVCCGYFGAIWSDCCLDGATSGMDAFVWSLCCIGFLVFVGTFCDVYCILSWLVYESSQANSFGRWKLPASRERDWKNTRNWSGQRDTQNSAFLKANKHGSTWLRYKRHQLELFNHLWMLLPPVAHPIAHPFFHIFRCPPGCLGTSGCMLPPGETRQRFGHRMSRTIHLFEATLRIPRARQ